jgi:hypothetical protein
VAFKLERQPVEMVPPEGGLVEACLRDEVIRDEVELGTFEVRNACSRTSWNRVWAAMRASVKSFRTCPARCRFSLPAMREAYTRSLAAAFATSVYRRT